MKTRFQLRRTLFTAAAFAVLAATSGVPAAHAAPPRTVTRASERDWLYDLHDFDDAPRPAGFFENGWSARSASAPASAPAFTAASPGAQPNAVLVPPGDTTYSRGRAVAISCGTAVVASNVNASVLNSSVYVYQGVGTATGSVSQSAQLTSADGQAGMAGDNFGISVSLAGGLGLVGAPAFSNSGYTPKVYVYNNLSTASGTVTESAQLRPSDLTGYTNFGFGVSLSGTSGLVGASNATNGTTVPGEAYLYRNLNTATGTVNENVRLLPSDAATRARGA